ncbi:carboxylate--amine ligase [Lactobacillus porci]|uniref:carboxylate--amine ligase n=1 Tax=Lactobacillus porci TaxID=2012477 RepID=UPI0039916674
MKYFIWAYNPKVVGIRPSQGISFIVPEAKKESYFSLGTDQIISVKRIDFQTVYPVFKKKQAEGEKITDIFTLQEEIMDWVGVLKAIFVPGKTGVSDVLFKDKYYMRSVLKQEIAEPNFYELTENSAVESIHEGMIKPRRADSTKGISYFKAPLPLSSLKNQCGYLSDKDLLVESFVHYDRMFTVDGYTDFQGHSRFFSHEYNNKLSDFKKTGYFTLHTSSFYYQDQQLLQKLFALSKQALQALNVEKDITPFHFEWFYSDKDQSFVFTEVGKRFGGAKIPKLVKQSFGVDLLEEYWKMQEGRAKEIDWEQPLSPRVCSSSYVQLTNGKTMMESIEDKIPDLFTYEQNYPIGEPSRAAESIGDAFFLAQFTSRDAAASDMASVQINKAFNEVCR